MMIMRILLNKLPMVDILLPDPLIPMRMMSQEITEMVITGS